GKGTGELGLSENTALVGLVPGASRPERQWPAESLAQAAGLLLQRRPCHFFILGTENERPLGEAVLRELPAGAATLLMGGLTAPLLAGHLEQLDLLITNDTGPMHLAAAVQTPVLALFLASARVWDTGPVGRGHLILEPRLDCHPCLTPCGHPRCRGLIPPETVADLAAARLLGVKGAPAPAGPTLSGVRLYETAVDPLGFHLPRPMVRRPLDRRHFWIMLHRLVWGELLDRRPLEEGERLAEWLTKRLDEDFLPPQDDLGLEAGLPVLREMVDLAGRGEATARQILRLARQAGAQPVRLWQAAQSLRSLDPALHRLALELPEAAAFVEFFFQEQRAGQEREVGPLSRALARAYRFLMGAGKRSLTGVRQLTGGTGRPVASHGVPRKMARTLHHQEQEKEEPHRPIEVTPCG
ncbi:MAG: glycosyltransferase family 9 protein, partial [Deltaproteobacteria bacterium]|nr:glycosyltransferase family 9 protein [Deltaproteobacteria bacterium]